VIFGYNGCSTENFPSPFGYTGCSATPCQASLHLRHLDASVAKWRRVVLTKNTGMELSLTWPRSWLPLSTMNGPWGPSSKMRGVGELKIPRRLTKWAAFCTNSGTFQQKSISRNFAWHWAAPLCWCCTDMGASQTILHWRVVLWHFWCFCTTAEEPAHHQRLYPYMPTHN